MFQPQTSEGGEFLSDDQIPGTLLPALRSIFDEMLPFIAACAVEVRKIPLTGSDKERSQRFLGSISYPMADGVHQRATATYPVWMTQRLLEALDGFSAEDQHRVHDWLKGVDGEGLLQLNLQRMQRTQLTAMRVG